MMGTGTVEFTEILPEDIDNLTQCYEQYLNGGDFVVTSIRKAVQENRYYGVKAKIDNETAGYFSFQKGIVLTYPYPKYEKELRKASKDRAIDTVDALMVIPRFRQKGLASELAKRAKKELIKRGVTQYMVEIWMYPDGSTPAKKIYEKMGKVLYSKVAPDFYKYAHEYGLVCPVCGRICKCGALLEIIDIS